MYNNDNYKLQNRLIKQVSTELGIPKEVVYKVVRNQWEMIKKVIENQDPETMFNSIKIKQLGIFGVKNFRFKSSKNYKHLHIPKDKITRDSDPRKQNTN